MFKNRGAARGSMAAVLAVLAVIAVLVGAWFWYSQKGPDGSQSAQALTAYIPASSRSFMAADLRVGDAWEQAKRTLQDQPEGLAEPLAELEKATGVPTDQLVAFFDGRFVAAYSNQGGQPAAAGLVGLSRSVEFRAWMVEKLGESKLEVAGLPFWKEADSLYYGADEQWFFWATDEKTAAELIATVRGEAESLAKDPRNQAALSKIQADASQVLVYADIQRFLGDLEKVEEMAELGFDARAFKELSELDYFVFQWSPSPGRIDAFLSVSGTEGSLAKKLTAKGNLQTAFLGEFSQNASLVSGFDSKWLLDLVVALGQVNSHSRAQAALIPMALVASGNPMGSFDGDVWFATDVLDRFGEMAGAATVPPDAAVVLVLPAQDSAKADAYLCKNLRLPAGHPPKPGAVKDYPLPLPNTKLELNDKGLVLTYGDATGLVEAPKLADASAVKDLLAWGGDSIVYFDAMNLGKLIEKLSEFQGEELAGFRQALETLKNSSGLKGYSCLKTSPEGVSFQMKGSGGGLPFYGGVGAAIVIPNFIRARGQGQLTACKSNLKNIGTGLEMWSTDHGGEYPDDLAALTPDYLKKIPQCPTAGTDTYSQSYNDYDGEGYHFYCSGEHHAQVGVPADHPSYDWQSGLIER
jgi:hypothetical protein